MKNQIDKTTPKEEKKTKYITITRAKSEYFMTDAMFKKLGDPDKLATNPHYRSAAKMKLYDIDRIEEWISKNLDWIEKTKERRQKLSEKQKQVHAKKRKKLVALANTWEPELFDIPNHVCEEAMSFYYNRYEDFDGTLTARGLVSYIRHGYTDYDNKLYEINNDHKGKTGVGELYPIFRPKVDEKIIEYLKGKGKFLLEKVEQVESIDG